MKKKSSATKKPFKNTMAKLHLWIGLPSSLVVFIVSITGCLFVFEAEIRNFQNRHLIWVDPVANQPYISVTLAENQVRQSYPETRLKQLRIYAAPNKSWTAHLTNDKLAYLNPYTGEILGITDKKDWLHVVEKIHTSLLLGEVGKWIIRINVCLFFILLISGLVLWWPESAARKKQALKVKWDASRKRLTYDLHQVLGFYSSLILIVIVLTGMYMSFEWIRKSTYWLTGSNYTKNKPITYKSAVEKWDAQLGAEAYQKVRSLYPGATELHINYPQKKNEVLKIKQLFPSSTYKKANDIYIHPVDGSIIRAERYTQYAIGDKIKHSNKDIHTGAFFGLFGKMIAFIASLIAASMPITGCLVWWNRRNKKKPVASASIATLPLVAG